MYNAKANGYMTLEAALVLPMTMGVVVLLIYLAFFQYNRCLLEQDAAGLALKGVACGENDPQEWKSQMQEAAGELYVEKYIGWEMKEFLVELSDRCVKVRSEGVLEFPFWGLGSAQVRRNWTVETSYENQRVNPVRVLRAYRKITGGE